MSGQMWPRWNRWLLDRPKLIKPFFTDQISFTLSCAELSLTINYLPIELNFHTGMNTQRLFRATGRINVYPSVLHYHDRVDANGFLLSNNIVSVNRQIEKINKLIRLTSEANFGKVPLLQLC